MSATDSPRRLAKQVRSSSKLFALEEIAILLLIQEGRSAVTPNALINVYRATGKSISKQWISDYMGKGDAIVTRLAVGHFKVMARYATEAGELALVSRDLEEAVRILAHHVTGAQDPWFGQAHPALCAMLAQDGMAVQGQWFESIQAAARRVLERFHPDLPTLAVTASHAMLGAWLGLVLEGRHQDEHRLAYLSGAFLGVVQSGAKSRAT